MNLVIIFCAKYLFVFVVLALGLAWWRADKTIKPKFAIATILAGAIAFLLSRIAGHVYYDPRPFVSEHVKPLIDHAADNGFPSDHALLTGTLTAITYFFNRKVANVMLLLTVAVGGARVLAMIHSPLDIAGGWALGIVGAVAGYYIASRWVAKFVANQGKAE